MVLTQNFTLRERGNPDMIGNWLKLLTAEQEDRVLTRVMGPGNYKWCLVGTACDYNALFDAEGNYIGRTKREALGAAAAFTIEDQRYWLSGRNEVEQCYDAACAHFGTERVNVAIRQRILTNRLRRSLASPRDNAVTESLFIAERE